MGRIALGKTGIFCRPFNETSRKNLGGYVPPKQFAPFRRIVSGGKLYPPLQKTTVWACIRG